MSENMGWKWASRKGPDWLPLYQIGVEGVQLLSCWVHEQSGIVYLVSDTKVSFGDQRIAANVFS